MLEETSILKVKYSGKSFLRVITKKLRSRDGQGYTLGWLVSMIHSVGLKVKNGTWRTAEAFCGRPLVEVKV